MELLQTHVVIIGGGYGGLRVIESLAKHPDITLTLIDKHPYHYLQTEAYGYIAGRFDIRDIAVDLEQWCQGFEKRVTFVHERAHSVDYELKKLQADTKEISFDYLVIATGAQTNFFSFIEGLREHSHGIKKLERAYRFRQEFEDLVYKQIQHKVSLQEEINLAIGGAGLSGVEVAAEMANSIQTYSKTIGARTKKIKIHLIDASETILPGMSPFIIKNTHARLEALGVEIHTNTFISSLNKEFIFFKDGSKLHYHFMIFTGGIKAANFANCVDGEKNKADQFLPNKYLNINERSDIFAIGDCVAITDKKGNILPPTAQVAERSAEYVAQNILDQIQNKEPKAFDAKVSGIFVALGGNYAVGEMFDVIKVKGYLAFLLKKAITYVYYLGLHLRINTGYKNRIKAMKKRD